MLESTSLKLLRDPTARLHGISSVNSVSWTERRATQPLFLDDPYDLGKSFFQMPETVSGTQFLLRIDSSWELDGHRTFVNEKVGFMQERCIHPEFNSYQWLLSADRDTSITWSEVAQSFERPSPDFTKVICIAEQCGVAVSAEPSNWGSFLARVVPKILMLNDMGDFPLFIYCHHPRQKEFLNLLGIPERRVIGQNTSRIYCFRDGIVPSEPTTDLFIERSARLLLRNFSARFKKAGNQKKIYVSRRSSSGQRNGRVCINEPDVESVLSQRGFEVICPELLSVQEQIEYFSQAGFVVGCSGAGMFNLVFSMPGTKVLDIESQSNWLWGHSNLFSSLGLEYGFLWARPTGEGASPHQPFEVDLKALGRRVDSWI